MPTYGYVCSKCGHEFDVFQAMSAEPFKICPKELCGQKRWGKGRVKRVLSAGAGLIFKGSGFYITDYRSEGYKEAAKKDKPSAPPGDKAKSSSSDGSQPKGKKGSKLAQGPSKS